MKPIAIAAIALMLPCAANAASRSYDTSPFDSVSAAQGIEVVITVGSARSVVAETRSRDFDDLRISVEGNALRIDRPARSWFSFRRRANYTVRVVTPVLRSLTASSGAEVSARGDLQGDLEANASSGSNVTVASIKGANVSARASSGSDIRIAGSCVTLKIDASSGSDVDTQNLQCESVAMNASSGSDVSLRASKIVTGSASSGSDIKVRGQASVQVEKSSGADVTIRN